MSNNLPSSYYFTLVVYPEEMKPDTINKLYNLGTIFFSPVHNKKKQFDGYIGEFKPSHTPKTHIHLLIKSCNKITENAFIKRFCELFQTSECVNLQGIALHKGDCLVKNPEMMLRYFYHLDNPMKERFNLDDAFEEVPMNFTEEVVKAFHTEIMVKITYLIQSGEIENIQQICFESNSAVYMKWLYTGRNMYVVNSMFNELRRNERLKK